MNPDHSKKVTDMIETICKQGCRQVNKILDKANNRNEIEELSGFGQAEIQQIITELDNIMSIYDENTTCDNKNKNPSTSDKNNCSK